MPAKYFKSGNSKGHWVDNLVWHRLHGMKKAMELVAIRHRELQYEYKQIEVGPKADSDGSTTEDSEPRYVSRSRA